MGGIWGGASSPSPVWESEGLPQKSYEFDFKYVDFGALPFDFCTVSFVFSKQLLC